MTALLLVTALAFGMTVTAVAGQAEPIQVTDPAKEFPTVTVETNLVMNEASGLPDVMTEEGTGKKYGFIEVALRVAPGATDVIVSQVAVALAYDKAILTPVTWGEMATEVTSAGPNPFDTLLPAKKADIIDSAVGRVGGEDATGYTAFSMHAEALLPVKLTADSRLMVVRFRYDAAANPLSYQAGAILNNGAALTQPLITWAKDDNAAKSSLFSSALFVGETPAQTMYYVHGDPNPANWVADAVSGLKKPATACPQLVKAVKAGGATADPDYYSYSSNFFPVDVAHYTSLGLAKPKIQFTQVTAATADQGSGGISLDDIVTVVFFDWDDTFLGATAVARGMDSREAVNTYVKENMIHPDLRTATQANFASLERQYTYRGEQPYTAPGGTGAIPEDANGDGVTDANAGSKFPLTNKLDYAFYMDFDDEFLFDDGWTVANTATELGDLWTALGTGATFNGFDFNLDMLALPAGVSSIFAKATYAPGKWLDGENTGAIDNLYTIISDSLTYGCYGGIGATSGSYSIRFAYNRVNAKGYGVSKLREPTLRVIMTPQADVDGWFYTSSAPESQERLDVEIVPSKLISSIDYQLVEAYGSTFVAGAVKSKISELGKFYNLENNSYGSDGFVREGALVYLSDIIEARAGGMWGIDEFPLIDAGLRDEMGQRLTDYSTAMMSMMYLDTVSGSVPMGERLDFYQMQYAIVNGGAYETAANAKTWYDTVFVGMIVP